MPFFRYKAVTKSAIHSFGRVEAEDIDQATTLLAHQGLIVVSLREESKWFYTFQEWVHGSSIHIKDKVAFFRQLATLIGSGIPLVQALYILVKETPNHFFSSIISDVAHRVESGSRFSEALYQHKEFFTDFVVNLVRSGENAGQLDLILLYITEKEEKEYELWTKIRSASLYPLILLLALMSIMLLMFFFIIPKFITLLEGLGGDLPLITRLFLSAGNFLLTYGGILFFFILLFLASGFLFSRTVQGKKFFHRIFLSLPFFRRIIRATFVVRFTQSLAVLLKGGVPLVTSLEIVSQAIENRVYREILERAIVQVEDGNSLAEELRNHREIPSLVTQLIAIGEQTGKLSEILERLSRFYTQEHDASTAILVGLLEPLVLVFLGAGVGLVMAAILLPIYNLASSF